MAISTTTALIIGGAMAATAGATAYSASQESKAAKKAAETQENVARMEIQAAKDTSVLAANEAKNKLKFAQARKSQTILTPPTGVNDNVNQKTILGV